MLHLLRHSTMHVRNYENCIQQLIEIIIIEYKLVRNQQITYYFRPHSSKNFDKKKYIRSTIKRRRIELYF